MPQKAIENPHHRPAKTKAQIIETHLTSAWRRIGGEMTIEEFSGAAYEAAAAICLRHSLEARIATGEIVPEKGKIMLRREAA